MSLRDLLQPAATHPPRWMGRWARVWMTPSIFSAQSYVVGIALLDDKGLLDFRLISDTSKFSCIYGDSGRTLVDQLISSARQALAQARSRHDPLTTETLPPGFKVDVVGYAAGSSHHDAMESAFCEAEVPLENSEEEVFKNPRFKSRSIEDITARILDALKLKLGNKADEHIRDTFFGTETHGARVNLVKNNSAGIIANGWYSRADRVQLELLTAVTTVESYMAAYKKTGHAGVFFLRPTIQTGLREDQSRSIENALDHVDWLLKQKGLRVATQDNEMALADDIAEWVDE